MTTAGEPATDSALYKRRVNDLMLEGLQALGPTDPIGFFCECSSPDCFTTVWWTRTDYTAARSTGRALLAQGHDAPDPVSHPLH